MHKTLNRSQISLAVTNENDYHWWEFFKAQRRGFIQMINQLLTEFYLSQWQHIAPLPAQPKGTVDPLVQLQHQNTDQSKSFDEEQEDAYWL